jgi:S1-C subfamily serine protease
MQYTTWEPFGVVYWNIGRSAQNAPIREKSMQEEKKNRDTGKTETDGENGAVDVDFMKEKIKARPVNRKKLFRRTVITVAFAVLFGVIACVVFILLEPLISRMTGPSEEAETTVTFPEATTEEMSPEDMIQSDTQIHQQETEEAVSQAISQLDIDKDKIREEIETSIREDLQADTTSTDAVEAQYSSLSEVAKTLQTSMVTVTGTHADTDWAGDAYEDAGKTSGVIVANQNDRLLVLADGEEMEDAQEIRVTFSDGTSAMAKVQAKDSVTGLCVLSVDENALSEDTKSAVTTATLGSSARADLLGKPVIAVGSPSGTQGSVAYGIVTNAALSIDITDSAFTGIQTDIYGSTQAGGMLADLKGRVIGWVDMDLNRKDTQNLISALGITELKPLIEALSNASSLACLGVHGTDVPESVQKEQGVPAGCYVTQVEMDSPAMNAGLQAGDVIQAFGTDQIANKSDLVNALKKAEPGQQTAVTIMRQGKDGYESASLTVTPADRITTQEQH